MKGAFTANVVWHMSASIELLTADQRFPPFSVNELLMEPSYLLLLPTWR